MELGRGVVLGANFPGGAGRHFVAKGRQVELLEGLVVHHLVKQSAPKPALLNLFVSATILLLAKPQNRTPTTGQLGEEMGCSE
jgi:hypothetical protein